MSEPRLPAAIEAAIRNYGLAVEANYGDTWMGPPGPPSIPDARAYGARGHHGACPALKPLPPPDPPPRCLRHHVDETVCGCGPACRNCGRPKWMHGTRHDTCTSFQEP